MTTKIRLALCALAVAAPGWVILRAASPAPVLTQGGVLVLENDRTLEGEVERVGEQYRVRRPVGETWVPAAKALRLCKDAEEAYAYLRSRANLEDPDERLRLARWCFDRHLREQARAEVTAAVELRPDHAETKRLLSRLQESAARAPEADKPAEKAPEAAPAVPSVDVTAESLGQFVTRVQPVLMNACVGCHGGAHAGAFRLTRVYESGGAGRRVTQQNLAAVLPYINFERPAASTFLTKAATAHADLAKAPLDGRKTQAFRALEDWVQATAAGNPHLRERYGRSVAALPAAEVKEAAEPKFVSEPRPAPAAGTKPEFAAGQASAPTPETPTEPITPAPVGQKPVEVRSLPPPNQSSQPPATPVDEFDPVIFNQKMHPGRKGS